MLGQNSQNQCSGRFLRTMWCDSTEENIELIIVSISRKMSGKFTEKFFDRKVKV